jgi:hypothetical protein
MQSKWGRETAGRDKSTRLGIHEEIILKKKRLKHARMKPGATAGGKYQPVNHYTVP